MQTFNITVKSKNRKSLAKFYNFFHKNTRRNLKVTRKFFQKKSNKKVITLLKSPHVNKTAQEQFELRSFSMQYKLRTTQALKFLVFLKKIKTQLFPDIGIKLKKVSNVLKQQALNKVFFNTDRYKKKYFKTIRGKNRVVLRNDSDKTNFHLKKDLYNSKFLLIIFDTYGK